MIVRQLIQHLLQYANLDDKCDVRLLRRDEFNCVTDEAILPISHIDSKNSICVEELHIRWKKFI